MYKTIIETRDTEGNWNPYTPDLWFEKPSVEGASEASDGGTSDLPVADQFGHGKVSSDKSEVIVTEFRVSIYNVTTRRTEHSAIKYSLKSCTNEVIEWTYGRRGKGFGAVTDYVHHVVRKPSNIYGQLSSPKR